MRCSLTQSSIDCMFEYELADLDAAQTLAASVREQARENDAAIQRLLLAAHYADLHPSPAMLPGDQRSPGGEREIRYGGPGCPGVAEFAVAEFGVVHGVSTESAAKFIGQALALRHRLPLIWQRIEAREVTAWKARQIATACVELSMEAAAIVDARVAAVVDTVGPIQLRNIVKAAVWDADPEAAKAAAEQKARERGVWVGRSDDHGTSAVFVKARTGDVIRFDATINQIADALTALDGPVPRDLQRARAFGVLTDPSLAHHLLQVAQYLAPADEFPAAEPPPAEPPLRESQADQPPANEPPLHHLRADDRPADESPLHDLRADDRPADEPPLHDPRAEGPPTDEPPLHDPRADERPADEPPADSLATCASPADPTEGRLQLEPSTWRMPATEAPPIEMVAGRTGAITMLEGVSAAGELVADLFLNDKQRADAGHDTAPQSPPNHRPIDPPQATRPTSVAEEIVANLNASPRQGLAAKLSAIKEFSDRNGGTRPGRTKLYVHLTDETLLAGSGCLRVEGFGPVYAQLAELVGHDRITVQPVIDLHDQINVNAYEIPTRLRERIKLTYPVEQFPYGPGETTNRTDIDHAVPYDPAGPKGQTSTANLRPLRRRSHRVKTFAGWKSRPLDGTGLEWTTRHGFKFRVDHTGTHPVPTDDP
ncbi:hypothetical protein [Kribbella sp. NPDC023855]|uniref:DUF222 domain-containing protein n=1 Tax=Kribbella sp. NPDC023855 TaxID=3154698 RepID=UPI0033FABB0D